MLLNRHQRLISTFYALNDRCCFSRLKYSSIAPLYGTMLNELFNNFWWESGVESGVESGEWSRCVLIARFPRTFSIRL